MAEIMSMEKMNYFQFSYRSPYYYFKILCDFLFLFEQHGLVEVSPACDKGLELDDL